ncbi:MAG: deoxyribose-phosphate aldolase [Chitinophagaceae bacterium]|nr:MAG: deoxyribose-phosphate aldolase [Chitinophagaceae bacterium]
MKKINERIEHTLLKPNSSIKEIKSLCEEAVKHNFAGVCVIPFHVKTAREKLGENSKVKLVTVVGFPFGYNCTSSKVEECKRAINDGVDEIDMVINLAALNEKNYNFVLNDIQSVATYIHLQNKIVKVIIESGTLDESQIKKACEICEKAEVNYVKTSTGFNGDGASVDAVKLMREVLPKSIKIKASGGIKDKKFAEELISAGADRLGTSSGINLISG